MARCQSVCGETGRKKGALIGAGVGAAGGVIRNQATKNQKVVK